MPPPAVPKIYHIVHVDRLPSIIADGVLWCDAEIVRRAPPGTAIGMNKIKQRRLTELHLSCHPGLLVGGCVPFYFARARSCSTWFTWQTTPSWPIAAAKGLSFPPGSRPEPCGCMGGQGPASLGFHPVERRLLPFRGSLRPGAVGRDQLVRGPDQPLGRERRLAVGEGREAGGVPAWNSRFHGSS